MSKSSTFYKKPWFIAAVVLAVLAIWIVFTYNGLVGLDQSVSAQWAQVESQYQRRYDLIPNLVKSVEEYKEFESGLLTEIVSLRTQWASATAIDEKMAVGSAWDSAMSRLLAVYENYPDLHTITAISNIMDQLEGTENRIATERMRYNEAVQSYNTAIKLFPTNMFASSFGFAQRPYFESTTGADQAPVVFSN